MMTMGVDPGGDGRDASPSPWKNVGGIYLPSSRPTTG